MTGSQHEYTATLVAGGDTYPIGIRRAGQITLDEGQAPHVTATLDLALPPEAILNELDPRGTARVIIDVDAQFPTMTQVRSFDLDLRTRRIRHDRNGYATVDLASDEARLADYRPLADVPLFAQQSSLVDVINTVLGMAVPGAELEAGAPDPDVTVYATTTNLFIDPASEVAAGGGYSAVACGWDQNDTSWTPDVADGFNLYSSTNTDSYLNATNDIGGIPYGMRAGSTYLVSASANVKVAYTGTDGSRARRIVAFYRIGTTGPYTEVPSAPAPNTPNTPVRLGVVFTIPTTATEVIIRFYHGGAAGGPGQIRWGAFRLSEYTGDPTDIGYYDGNTTDTAAYLYDWTGPVLGSPSTRRALIDRPPASLLWKAGIDALTFLHPLVQAFGYRLVCDEARKWTLREEDYLASTDTLGIFDGVNLIDGEDLIDRDGGLWFDAQITRYRWTDEDGTAQERVDSYALNDPPTRVNLVEVAAAYPGPGRSEYAVRRAQGRGREITATAVADWRTHAEQPITVGLHDAPLQVGETSSVTFTLADDRMTVVTRTVEMPPGAIDLEVGTIDSWTGTIDTP